MGQEAIDGQTQGRKMMGMLFCLYSAATGAEEICGQRNFVRYAVAYRWILVDSVSSSFGEDCHFAFFLLFSISLCLFVF